MNNKLRGALMLLSFLAPPLMAAGGLDEGTQAVNDFRIWFYGFLGAGSLAYIGYNAGLAMFEKQQWNDVALAFGKVAVAGGSVIGADWAWSIWGS